MAHLLVVEPDIDLREILSMVLTREGHRATTSGSGRDAIVLAGRGSFDLVVLDLDASDIAGDEVTRVVRDVGDVPVVLRAGRAEPWKSAAFAAGATACLDKPFSIEGLTSLVRSVLRAQRPEREGAWPTDVRRLSGEDLERVRAMEASALDSLPFGVIAIGPDGRIVDYNAYEQEASTYWGPSVIGMHFYDLAPCTMVKEFTRELDRAIAGGPVDEVLRFVFPHHAAMSVVSVRIHRGESSTKVWLFVSKRRGTDR